MHATAGASASRYGQFDDNGVYRILMGVRDYELDQFGELLEQQAGVSAPPLQSCSSLRRPQGAIRGSYDSHAPASNSVITPAVAQA